MSSKLVVLLSIVVAFFGAIRASPLPLIYQPVQYSIGSPILPASHAVSPHRAVELNAALESQLPRELLKSRDFYDNPAVAEGLAKESWFTNKEMQVVEREAEKIPREQIYKIFKNAGFLDG